MSARAKLPPVMVAPSNFVPTGLPRSPVGSASVAFEKSQLTNVALVKLTPWSPLPEKSTLLRTVGTSCTPLLLKFTRLTRFCIPAKLEGMVTGVPLGVSRLNGAIVTPPMSRGSVSWLTFTPVKSVPRNTAPSNGLLRRSPPSGKVAPVRMGCAKTAPRKLTRLTLPSGAAGAPKVVFVKLASRKVVLAPPMRVPPVRLRLMNALLERFASRSVPPETFICSNAAPPVIPLVITTVRPGKFADATIGFPPVWMSTTALDG